MIFFYPNHSNQTILFKDLMRNLLRKKNIEHFSSNYHLVDHLFSLRIFFSCSIFCFLFVKFCFGTLRTEVLLRMISSANKIPEIFKLCSFVFSIGSYHSRHQLIATAWSKYRIERKKWVGYFYEFWNLYKDSSWFLPFPLSISIQSFF